jgi:hypothetical protein
MREGEWLDQDLVELETVDHLKSVEVPNDDISLNIKKISFFVWEPSQSIIFNNAFKFKKIGRSCGKKVRPTVIAPQKKIQSTILSFYR